jgi:hypothetical protein
MTFIVKDNSDGENTVKLRVVNLSNDLLYQIDSPIFGTSTRRPQPEELNLWAKSGRRNLEANIQQWDSEKCRGKVLIKLSPPLPPRQSRYVHWGYQMPSVWNEGNEFVQWNVSHQIYRFLGRILTDLTWEVRFRKVKQRYRIKFGLTRASTLS